MARDRERLEQDRVGRNARARAGRSNLQRLFVDGWSSAHAASTAIETPASSIVAVAVVFSIAHLTTPGTNSIQLGCIALTGCLYGYIRFRYRSTAAAALAHGSYNLALYISYWCGVYADRSSFWQNNRNGLFLFTKGQSGGGCVSRRSGCPERNRTDPVGEVRTLYPCGASQSQMAHVFGAARGSGRHCRA